MANKDSPTLPSPASGGGELEALLTKKKKKSGPLTVADYMSLCLTHPEFGYYMRRDPFGEKGDFTTAYIKQHFPDGFQGVPPTSEQEKLLIATAAGILLTASAGTLRILQLRRRTRKDLKRR